MTNDEMTKALSEVRDELIRRDAHRQLPESPAEVRAARKAVANEADRKALVSSVLYSMLVTLNGWIVGAYENHEALGHRGEPMGEECWRSFAPADFRQMVNDVAAEFGVSEFPQPEVPVEDAVR